MTDPFDLERFVAAQNAGDIYDQALSELRGGRKRGHWMWFVFPQIAGLGVSPTSRFYAISRLPEARAYLAHPILGPRLLEISKVLTELSETDATRVFGSVDAAKLRSSMTLFASARPAEKGFRDVLDQYFSGRMDEETLRRLSTSS